MIRIEPEPSRAEVGLHYDELDWLYREIWGEHLHHGLWRRSDDPAELAVCRLVEVVAHRARIAERSRVCDVGCGYGGTARLLHRSYGAFVTGITVSRAQYEHATSRSDGEWPRFLLADWKEVDLGGSVFDAVLAIESTEHMSDLPGCFDKAASVMSEGGRLVVAAWLAAPQPKSWEVRYLLRPICHEGRLCHMGTREDYTVLLERAGFEIVGFEDLSHEVMPTWSLCIGRVARRVAVDPRYRRFLLDRDKRNRVFAATLFRIWAAYRTGAMRYGLFTASKAG